MLGAWIVQISKGEVMMKHRKVYAGTRRLENAKTAMYAAMFSKATQEELALLGTITRNEYVHLLHNMAEELAKEK